MPETEAGATQTPLKLLVFKKSSTGAAASIVMVFAAATNIKTIWLILDRRERERSKK